MKRTFTTLIVTSLFLSVANLAWAGDKTPLGQCVADCESQLKLICYDESNRDISALCSMVDSCKGLSAGDVAAASALLGACYEGVTSQCPKNCPKGGATPAAAPPVGAKNPPAGGPPSRRDQCKASGGFYLTEPGETKKFCYNHQAMYEHLRGVEGRVAELEEAVKALREQGQPVPDTVKQEVVDKTALIALIKEQLGEHDRALLGRLESAEKRLNDLNPTLDDHGRRLDKLEGTVSANSEAIEGMRGGHGNIKPALTGWSVAPYFTFQSFRLYDKFMYAGGLELGVYPSVSASGRHRLAVVFGGGKANDYFERSMLEMHLFGGYRYSGEAGGFSLGAGTHRYSRTDVQQGRLFWVGPEVEGRVNLASWLDESKNRARGANVYLLGRVGAGYRYGRHGILDPRFEPIEGRFDIPAVIGLGFEEASFF